MREINFFTPYILSKRTNRIGLSRTIIAFVFMIVLCTGFYGWNLYKINKYEADIISYETFLLNPANIAAEKNFAETRKKMDILNQYSDGLVSVEKEFTERGILGSVYLNKLNSAIPHAIYLENMNISYNNVSINGISSSRNAIAEYQHNLLKLGLFEDVFVSILSNTDKGSSDIEFSVNCMLRGDASDETK
jgi:type IV pilus assembly protein PilN